MKNFRDLKVWQKAHKLVLAAYQVSSRFPKQEMFGLTSQIRRCSASIPSNIAEGCGKRGNAEFCRYLNIALGSASELEYQFLLAHDLGFLEQAEYNHMEDAVTEVKRMLAALMCKVDAERFAAAANF